MKTNTTVKTKVISTLLALVLLFSMIPIAVFAADTTVPTIYVGGAELAVGSYIKNGAAAATPGAPEADDTGYAYLYDNAGVLTLELNSAEFTGPTSGTSAGKAIYISNDADDDTALTVKLVGESKLTGSAVEGINSAGIFCVYASTAFQCDLTFTGSGTLYATGADTNPEDSSYGISGSQSITIESGTVIATGGAVTDEDSSANGTVACSYGIYAVSGVTVKGGYLKATGGNATQGASGQVTSSLGILTIGGSINIEGGEVYAQSGTATDRSLAMQCSPLGGSVTTPTGYTVKAGDSAESAAEPSESLNTYKYVSAVPGSRPTINITAPANGTVTATVGGAVATAAAPGAGVKLTATPASGYKLDSLTVTDGNNNPIPVDSGSCFTMPTTAVTVTAAFSELVIPATGVTLDKTSLTLTVGDTATLTATVAPSDATNKNVTWESSDTVVAKVNGGTITTLVPGRVTITVTTEDGGFKDTCVVTINAKSLPGSVTLSGTAKYGETLTARYESDDKNVTGDYQWYRGDQAIDGAINSTYTLTAADIGKIIKVVLIGTGNYSGEISASTATAVEALTFADSDIAAQGYTGEYDGSAHGISVTAPTGATVKYGTAEGTYNLTSSPTLTYAGTLTVYYQVTKEGYNAVTGSATVAISKATPTYTVPTGLTAAYGQTLADVELPAGFAWQDDDTTSVGNVGNNTFKVTYTPTDTDNYNTVTDIEVTVKVSFAVEATSDGDSWGTVKLERDGDKVKLTATPAEGMRFEYWLDTSAASRSALTEAQLKDAIVSYDAQYQFTVTKNTSLKAVFSVPFEVPVTPMLITGTDKDSLAKAEELQYAVAPIIPGKAATTLPGEVIDEIITVGGKQYSFAGFIFYDDEKDADVLKETYTIGAMPVYDSVEYWDWSVPISDGLRAAYVPYTPAPQGPTEPENPDDPKDPDEPQTPNNPQDPGKPDTGDSSHLALWLALLFVSGGCLFGTAIYKKNKKTQRAE